MGLSRRNFFRPGSKNQLIIRPPWALDEEEFIDRCTRCDECIRACPEKIISRGDGGFPEVSFSQSGCELCADCVEVCKDGALEQQKKALPWQHKIQINDDCLPKNNVICRTCSESCLDDVFSFTLVVGKVAEPTIDLERCTGCGFCIATCPSKAISILNNLAQEDG